MEIWRICLQLQQSMALFAIPPISRCLLQYIHAQHGLALEFLRPTAAKVCDRFQGNSSLRWKKKIKKATIFTAQKIIPWLKVI